MASSLATVYNFGRNPKDAYTFASLLQYQRTWYFLLHTDGKRQQGKSAKSAYLSYLSLCSTLKEQLVMERTRYVQFSALLFPHNSQLHIQPQICVWHALGLSEPQDLSWYVFLGINMRSWAEARKGGYVNHDDQKNGRCSPIHHAQLHCAQNHISAKHGNKKSQMARPTV